MAFSETSFRDTWAEINLEHIYENVARVKKNFRQEMNVMAVVKADGYGHGAVRVAKTALRAGASYLGVALLEEAMELRKAGIDTPILVLGRTRPSDADIAAFHNITLTVFQEEWLKIASRYLSKPLAVHLKFDTGMGRIGLREEQEAESILDYLAGSGLYKTEGIFTHFATADELDDSYFTKQYERFLKVLDLVEKKGVKPKYIHCGNSATGLRFPSKAFNMFRFGISMYGLSPSEEIKEVLPYPLKEAFSLHSTLVQVKKVPKGESISYGATYTTQNEEWIGTVPIGYADGWYRYHSTQGGYVLVEGEEAPITGRVCMDQMMVRLPYKMEVGTKVTLIGKQGGKRIMVDDIAERLGTINYEVPCMISKRVPRVYREQEAES
ncbi:alanine racemase [Bacillus sp. FJAT-44742]|uniref:alanine racemase n=1 Tax=Bacillus sp. FJAT-44742 TaxID=2014005 RepID=UPI000C231D98|nr:alanine racemase [Bacillus sp. FJAT-44742]